MYVFNASEMAKLVRLFLIWGNKREATEQNSSLADEAPVVAVTSEVFRTPNPGNGFRMSFHFHESLCIPGSLPTNKTRRLREEIDLQGVLEAETPRMESAFFTESGRTRKHQPAPELLVRRKCTLPCPSTLRFRKEGARLGAAEIYHDFYLI